MNRAVASVLLMAALAGCGDGTVAAPDPRFDGTYALMSVNGSSLPALLQPPAPGPATLVISGTLVVARGGRYTISSIWDEISSVVTIRRSITCEGTWARTDAVFTFTELSTANCGGGDYTGTWDGADRFTVELAPGLQAMFER